MLEWQSIWNRGWKNKEKVSYEMTRKVFIVVFNYESSYSKFIGFDNNNLKFISNIF